MMSPIGGSIMERAVAQGQSLAGHLSLEQLFSTTGHRIQLADHLGCGIGFVHRITSCFLRLAYI